MMRLAFPLAALALLAVTLVIYGQGWLGASPLGGAAPTTTITSAGSPTGPVPFIWSTHVSHREDGHRLFLQGGSLDTVVDEVRLVSPDGTVVAGATTVPLKETDHSLCETTIERGMVQAGVPLSRSELEPFRGNRSSFGTWPSGYRVEARVGGAWRPVQLTFAGCLSIE
jgi:hypothetical protein